MKHLSMLVLLKCFEHGRHEYLKLKEKKIYIHEYLKLNVNACFYEEIKQNSVLAC